LVSTLELEVQAYDSSGAALAGVVFMNGCSYAGVCATAGADTVAFTSHAYWANHASSCYGGCYAGNELQTALFYWNSVLQTGSHAFSVYYREAAPDPDYGVYFGVYALKGARTGKYCSGNGLSTAIGCAADAVGTMEKFTLEKVGDNLYSVRGLSSGKYCSDRNTFVCDTATVSMGKVYVRKAKCYRIRFQRREGW
jgi:hypothetical protein